MIFYSIDFFLPPLFAFPDDFFFSFLHYHHRHRRIKSSLITRLITEIDSCNEGCKHYLEAIRKDALKVLSYAKEP